MGFFGFGGNKSDLPNTISINLTDGVLTFYNNGVKIVDFKEGLIYMFQIQYQ